MMSKGLRKFIENITYYAGLIISIVGLYLTFKARRGLPEGACPVENYSWVLITGIVLFLASMVFSFGNKDDENDDKKIE